MIEIINLEKTISNKVLFSNANFLFENGKIYSIYGKNGSGKTTLLNIISHIDNEFKGEIKSNGNTGFVVQFVEHMVCKKNVFLEVNSIVKNDVVTKKILMELKLYDKKEEPPFILSEGEKRLMFIKAALEAFDNILLDEPFANLDKEWKIKVGGFIKEAAKNGKLVIYTANREQDCKYTDVILELDNGKLYKRNS